MVLWTLFAFASSADAQAALAASTSVTQGRLPANARLTLRPSPGFEQLAAKVARVLTLRGNTSVEVGDEPPPGLLEAVAAGQIAIASGPTPSSAHLVLGSAMGESLETTILLSPDGEEDVRALALAIEALRDRAMEMREMRERSDSTETDNRDDVAAAGTSNRADAASAQWPNGQAPANTLVAYAPMPASEPANTGYTLPPSASDEAYSGDGDPQYAPANQPAPPAPPPPAPAAGTGQPAAGHPYQLVGDPRDAEEMLPRPDPSERTLKVKPRLYLSVYGGASAESRALRTGVATGGGLCVRGQCLLLGLEYPLPMGLEQGADDVRYRYPTFSCTFLSQPFTFGPFTPGVSVGILSRVGHFERDMGRTDYLPGLDTDLAVRGTLEASFQVVESIDVMAQAGVDYALDRWQYTDTGRGSRVAPWLQAGIRVRPE
jgi:hypothetical protein